jgi:hypothetical protein
VPRANAKKTAKPKAAKAAPRPWTEVDTFYLKGNFDKVPTATLAETLGRTVEEVNERCSELALRPKTPLDRMSLGHGAVAMTPAESAADDKRPRPKRGVENPRLRGAVKKIWPDKD